MRKAGQTVVGKAIATIFFGALIVSFAIWGIGDIFRVTPASTVAEVGSTSISVNQVRTAYTNELQRLGRQFRTVISPEQARAFGLDRQVVDNLVTEAVLAEQAKQMGLSVSDELVAASIVNNPTFKGADGQFNRALFDQVSPRPVSCRSSVPPWLGSTWRKPLPATSTSHWPPRKPCTGSAASAARPHTST
jgi:peptidyl-prolyl cis-trans isomerase D